MQQKNSGIVLVAALALAFAASPALAQKGGGDGGGGAAAGGGGAAAGGGGDGGKSGGGMSAPAAGAPASSKVGGGGVAAPAAGAPPSSKFGGGAGFSGNKGGGGRSAEGGYRRGGGFDGRRHFRHRGYGLGYGAYGAAPYVPYGYYDDSYPYGNEPVYEVAPGSTAADAYCARRFRSYDPASGTYLGFDGERHPCP